MRVGLRMVEGDYETQSADSMSCCCLRLSTLSVCGLPGQARMPRRSGSNASSGRSNMTVGFVMLFCFPIFTRHGVMNPRDRVVGSWGCDATSRRVYERSRLGVWGLGENASLPQYN